MENVKMVLTMQRVHFLLATVPFLFLPDVAHAQRVTKSDLSSHIVMIHAETRPRGLVRYFPAIVLKADAKESVLVSASWGAEPFPGPPKAEPIGSIHVLDSDEPVKILAYDQELGVAVFSVQQSLQPWPKELMTEEVGVGDVLKELVLKNRAYRPSPRTSHKVVATDQVFPNKTAHARDVKVKETVIIKGKLSGCPGSVLLKDGKLAAIFLNNSEGKRHVIPTKVLLKRYRKLLSRTN